MSKITSKIEFDNLSATLCGRMVSLDSATRHQAATEAETLLADLPKFLRNSPHCRDEIAAINTLVSRVRAEGDAVVGDEVRFERAMSVQSRIEQAPACEVINLTEAEKDIYNGCGWKLARFVNGRLVGLFDPTEAEYRKNVHAMVEEALENANSEVWLVMCSCCQLCEPRRITLTDASALAKLARMIGESFADI
jgi:hypothetical protein